MSVTRVVFGEELKEDLLLGVDLIEKAVGSTLGPNGRNVLFPEKDVYRVTKDGVTVASAIANMENSMQNAAAKLIIDVARKTAKEAGDGTTTATILAANIYSMGIAMLKENPKLNPINLNKQIQEEVKNVVDYIKENAVPVENLRQLTNIATVSTNGDSNLGELIAMAMWELGVQGILDIGFNNTTETYYSRTTTYRIASGFIRNEFITDKAQRCTELSSPLVVLCEKKISLFRDIEKAIEIAATSMRDLLIIAEDVDGEALHTVVANAMQQPDIKIAAIRVPALGKYKNEVLQDYQALMGGTIFSDMSGTELRNIQFSDFGNARSVRVFDQNTYIIPNQFDSTELQARLSNLALQMTDAPTEMERRFIEGRYAYLSFKCGVISIGGNSEIEKQETKDRVEDGICATRAALEEGLVVGGGCCYRRYNKTSFRYEDGPRWLIKLLTKFRKNSSINKGAQIVQSAIEKPFIRILSNSGKTAEDIDTTTELRENSNFWYGFNARTEVWEDLRESGVVDPAKVTRVALENAASIAGALLTSDCGIYYE